MNKNETHNDVLVVCHVLQLLCMIGLPSRVPRVIDDDGLLTDVDDSDDPMVLFVVNGEDHTFDLRTCLYHEICGQQILRNHNIFKCETEILLTVRTRDLKI